MEPSSLPREIPVVTHVATIPTHLTLWHLAELVPYRDRVLRLIVVSAIQGISVTLMTTAHLAQEVPTREITTTTKHNAYCAKQGKRQMMEMAETITVRMIVIQLIGVLKHQMMSVETATAMPGRITLERTEPHTSRRATRMENRSAQAQLILPIR
jgi:hypothetical protein